MAHEFESHHLQINIVQSSFSASHHPHYIVHPAVNGYLGAYHGSFELNSSGPGGTSGVHITCCEKVAGPPASSYMHEKVASPRASSWPGSMQESACTGSYSACLVHRQPSSVMQV